MTKGIAFAATAASFRGERIGKYEVVAQLSVGGMAELFLAFTSGPGGFRKFVVVKRVLPDLRHDDQFVKMFLDEARISAGLSHPNIAQVFDLDESEEGMYLAMEFIAGQNLNQVYAACRKRKTPLPVGFTCAVARDVSLALHYAHTFVDAKGQPSPIIHRDVAQKNVMVGFEGSIKLLDFGIAKAVGSLGRTRAGIVKGTTGYMSPEQVTNGQLDGRSDVFSVGVVLHELLTGKRLFAAATEEEEMRKILSARIPKPTELNPELPDAVSDVVMRALARERADRYASAKELARALETACGKWLFDRERVATFMRELFEEKVAATRAMLESVDGKDPEVLHRALAALRQDDGMIFEGASSSEMPSKRDAKTDAYEAPAPPKPAEPTRPARGAAAVTKVDAPARRSTWIFLVAAVVFAGLLGFAGMKLLDLGQPEKPLPRGFDPTGGMQPLPGSLIPSPQQPEPAPSQTQPSPGTPSEPEAKHEEKHTVTPHGGLTLVTLPDAEVFLGGKKIGKTPLFNQPLPVGVHKLRLRGPDGKNRYLSVPIVAGKTAALKFSLGDLPTR